MKYIVLTVLLIFINNAKSIEVEVLVGYAHHYNKMHTYNDITFNDNKTSDIALLRLTYNKLSLNLLSDSNGNFSIAPTYNTSLIKNNYFNVTFISGLYIMRDDNYMYSNLNVLPQLNVANRAFSIMPLIGLQTDVKITKSLDFTSVITPTFILIGIKINL